MSELVCFAYGNNNAADPLMPDRPLLFGMLAERGLGTVVSSSAAAPFAEAGFVEAGRPEWTEEGMLVFGAAGKIALHQEVRAIVNRASRVLRTPDLPPVINEDATRFLGYNKWRIHQEVFEQLGIGMPTAKIDLPADVESFLETHASSRFVAKPFKGGTYGNGVLTLDRDSVLPTFDADTDIYGTHILQPHYDLTVPFPAGLRPYDCASREQFTAQNQPGKRKELRMYGFHTDGVTYTFPAARTLDPGDNWFFIDPDSVPETVVRQTGETISQISKVTGARGMYCAVDFGYGGNNTEEASWRLIEANMRSPYMIGSDKHAGVAYALRTLFADQLRQLVHENVS